MKHEIIELIKSRKLYFRTLLLLFIMMLFSILFFGKTFAFVPLNTHHPFWLNVFFINYTFMGNGLFVICLSGVLIFRFNRIQEGRALLYGFILSGILIQLLNNLGDLLHPTLFIEQGQCLFPAGNNSVNDHSSIISGHTCIAFELATVLILVIKNTKWQLPLLAGVVLLAYSRIYLEQHLLKEIMIAVVSGTISGIAAVYLVYYFKGIGYYYKKFFGIYGNAAVSTSMIDHINHM
jgi:membrane-associated phospholipid phosphatase